MKTGATLLIAFAIVVVVWCVGLWIDDMLARHVQRIVSAIKGHSEAMKRIVKEEKIDYKGR